jgi:hypothetical protein
MKMRRGEKRDGKEDGKHSFPVAFHLSDKGNRRQKG